MPRELSNYAELQQYELTTAGELPNPSTLPAFGKKYPDGSSIDWLQEEAAERERSHALHSQAGVRGALLPALDAARMWIVVIGTGIGIGLAGAWLDVLVKWSVAVFRHPLHAMLTPGIGWVIYGRDVVHMASSITRLLAVLG